MRATVARRRRARARELVRLQGAQERAFAAQLVNTLRTIAKGAARAYEAGGEGEAVAHLRASRPGLQTALAVHLNRVARVFADNVLTSIRKAAAAKDRAFERTVRTFVERQSFTRADNITEASVRRLQSILADAIDEGMTTSEIAGEIRTVIGSASRASLIARTETHTAASAGMDLQAQATGLDLTRVWQATEDERTRPSHAEADQQKRKMGEPFLVGGAHLSYPGDPSGPPGEIINCRCVLLYEPGDASD